MISLLGSETRGCGGGLSGGMFENVYHQHTKLSISRLFSEFPSSQQQQRERDGGRPDSNPGVPGAAQVMHPKENLVNAMRAVRGMPAAPAPETHGIPNTRLQRYTSEPPIPGVWEEKQLSPARAGESHCLKYSCV